MDIGERNKCLQGVAARRTPWVRVGLAGRSIGRDFTLPVTQSKKIHLSNQNKSFTKQYLSLLCDRIWIICSAISFFFNVSCEFY